MMSNGTPLAILIVLGYVGFEAYAVYRVGYRVGYRMEATYIFDQFVSAKRAQILCGNPQA